MKKILLILMLLAIVVGQASAITYDQDNYKQNRMSSLSAGQSDPLFNFIGEIEGMLEGTSSSTITNLLFDDSITSDPTSTEGRLYYNVTAHLFRFYNGSSWTDIEANTGGLSLDGSYGLGTSITVDNGPVTLTASNSADNIALAVVQSDTGATVAQTITSAGTGALLSFDSNGAGGDMLGSDSTWSMSKAGVLVYVGGTISGDLSITGTTKDIEFDVSRNMLHFLDDAVLGIGGATTETADATLSHDGSNLSLLSKIADEGFLIGGTTLGFDITYAFETAGQFRTDYDADFINLTDDMELRTGTGASADGDFKISSNSSNVLQIEQVVADTGTITVGADGAGIDTKFFGEEAGDYMLWDGTGASQLLLNGADSSGTLFAVVGIDTSGNSDSATITHSGTGAALKLISSEADTQLLELASAANQTTWLQVIDGDVAEWIGADNIGMLHLKKGATALADAGASQLIVLNTSQPIASAEGFLARFISTGAARTDAYAVEIEVPATQPALFSNGIVTVTGQDNIGAALVQITGNNAAGNLDTVTINTEGTGDGLQIQCDDADSVAANFLAAANQTTAVVKIDGATADWIGADNVGMLQLSAGTTAPAHAGASQIIVTNTATPIANAEGFLTRFIDTGANQASTAYCVEIETTNNEALHVDSGKVVIDETLTATLGVQYGVGEALTTAGAEGASGTVDDGVSFASVDTTTGVTEFITLPNDPPVGTKVTIGCNAGGNFEIRTLAAGNDTINDIDTSNGAVEYLATDEDTIVFTYHVADAWIGVSYTKLGAVRTAVVPD